MKIYSLNTQNLMLGVLSKLNTKYRKETLTGFGPCCLPAATIAGPKFNTVARSCYTYKVVSLYTGFNILNIDFKNNPRSQTAPNGM